VFAMPIHTVLGPIEARELGPTSMHEHVLIDGRVWLTPPLEPMPADPTVCLENIGFLRWNLVSLEDNLVLDDVDLAVDELTTLVAAGGSGIVDLTNIGLGRRVADLVGVSRRTGLRVMVGCGFYVGAAHPEWARTMTVDELAALLIQELDQGIDDTQIRPALRGEIGTSAPVTPQEVKVLEAAAIAAAQTGSAISIHLDARGTQALPILEILVRHGVEPGRIIFGHLDEHLDRGYHDEVAASGAVIEFDTFGTDMYWGGLFKDPSDVERMVHLLALLEGGPRRPHRARMRRLDEDEPASLRRLRLRPSVEAHRPGARAGLPHRLRQAGEAAHDQPPALARSSLTRAPATRQGQDRTRHANDG